MNICIVDDQPKFKVLDAINYLKEKKLNFNYLTFKSSNSALQYILTNISDIDLIVLDLGLPKLDNGIYYNKYEGIFIMEQIFKKTKNIPIIINSTTVIYPDNNITEKEYLESFKPAIVEHIEHLSGFYLYEFLETYLSEKIEFQ